MPGNKRHLAHSKKHLNRIKEMIRAVDVVLELVDARAPQSSQNEELYRSVKPGGRIIVLHKSDLANPDVTRCWVEHFQKQGLKVFSFSAKLSSKKLLSHLNDYWSSGKFARFNRPLRLMVAGMPNVGKSTLVNLLLQKKVTHTGDRPGITRGSQWIRIHPRLELLDTPGVLQPAAGDEWTYQCLAALGILPPNKYDSEETALWLINLLKSSNRLSLLSERFGVEPEEEFLPEEYLKKIGKARGCLIGGGEVNFQEASQVLLKDLREGLLGAISLEAPPEEEEEKGEN